jgi:hypothetical protein
MKPLQKRTARKPMIQSRLRPRYLKKGGGYPPPRTLEAEPTAARKRILLSQGVRQPQPFAHASRWRTLIMRSLSALAVPVLLLTTALTGCHITSHKDGKNDDVNIGTPFGSMQVKTNDNVEVSGIGITPYPGAILVKKDHDNGAADVNMSFGSFHLNVKAVSYTTSDSPEKVMAFYKKDLGKYGAVIHCEGKRTVGVPIRTDEGLTCDFDSGKNGHVVINTGDDSDETELRTGSKQHQHIVKLESKDGGTKIGLVALELPSNFTLHDHKDGDKDSD